jgi:DNA-binding transcriptional LysR family regulator
MAVVAEAISLTPSAVSQQLASLERQAGVRLLEPDGRRVRLTAAGRALAERANPILGALRDAAEEIAALDSDAIGELRLASFPSVAAALCPTVISALAERHPRHRVRLAETDTAASIAAVVSGEVDVALVDEPFIPLTDQHPITTHRELHADPLYCVLPADHPRAPSDTIDLREVARERWVMDHPTCPFYRQTVALCQAAGFQPNVIANTESVSVSSALVRAGAGIAILPGLALAGVTDLAIRPIVPPTTRRLYAVFRKNAHLRPSIATALDLLGDTAASVGQSVAAIASNNRLPNPVRP